MKGVIIVIIIMLGEFGIGLGMAFLKLRRDPEYQNNKKSKKINN